MVAKPARIDKRQYQGPEGRTIHVESLTGTFRVLINSDDRDGYQPSNPELAEYLDRVLVPVGFRRVWAVQWDLEVEEPLAALHAAFGKALKVDLTFFAQDRVLPMFEEPGPDATDVVFEVVWFNLGPSKRGLKLVFGRNADGSLAITGWEVVLSAYDEHPDVEGLLAEAGLDLTSMTVEEAQALVGDWLERWTFQRAEARWVP